jgi:phosphatidate cytidylyltransferase
MRDMSAPDSVITSGLFWNTELGKRILSGIVMVALAMLATYEGDWLFSLFWLLAGIRMLFEWLRMACVPRLFPLLIVLGAALLALSLSRVWDHALQAGLAAIAGGCLALAVMASNRRDALWVLGGFLVAAILVKVPPLVRDDPDFAILGLAWMFAVVWTTDIAAFFTGRTFGGPKLWPKVSPNKTWSGFVGGILGGTAAGIGIVLWGAVYPLDKTSLMLISGLSVMASLATQAGDLAESAMKRHFKVKDAGSLIPGHGGVMDRLDGFFAVAALIGLLLFGSWLF